MGFITPEGDGVRILVLDGGDTRCLSQLIILDELMTRLKHDLGRDIRPCEYFHSITGVGASGVVAVLLGVLGLSIERATDAFGKICQRVFPAEGCSEIVRSARLADAMRSLLDELHIPTSTRLQSNIDTSFGCRVSVCYSAMAASGCRMFRNYQSRHPSHNPTIIEAVQAAWATPGLFASIRIGTAPMQEQLVSAVNGFNNPALQAITEAQEVLRSEKPISSILSLGSIKTGSFSTSPMDVAIRAAQETEATAENLQRRFGTLGIYFRFSVENIVEKEYLNLEAHFDMITANTREYLAGDIVSHLFDSYMKVSEHTSTITLDRLLRSRIDGYKSSHGLPPLSAFFITRIAPMEEITVALERDTPGSPAIAIVTGLGGTGKTQISLKYAYNNDDEYDHIFFVDASSTESLEKTLISRIRSIDRQLRFTGWEEALNLLENPDGNLTRNWFMIMDNADDVNVDLTNYIPQCDHGSILITSRNVALGDLDPDGHVSLDVMSREEAVEALLSAALGPLTPVTRAVITSKRPVLIRRTAKDHESAAQIVEELGYLPLAVIQAACYIKKHKCLHDYSNLLKTSRSSILRWPASVQRDKLKYAHSTYAAFDTTISALSSRALQFLGIISFVHFSDFPRTLIAISASAAFGYQSYDLMDQPPEYQPSIVLLQSVFCPNGRWEQVELDCLLEELQTYSLVTLVPVSGVITLRFHPLIHGWANDRLSDTERTLFQAAAIRLLVCGTNEDDEYLWSFLSPHIERFDLTTKELHINDRGALASVLGANGQTPKALAVWEDINSILEGVYGKENVITTRSALQLAKAYGDDGDWDRMNSIQREVVRVRKEQLGGSRLETAEAMAALGRSCREESDLLEEAVELEAEVLRVRREVLGPEHRKIAEALRDLAATRMLQEEYTEAQKLLEEATGMLRTLVGKLHPATIKVMEQQAKCYKHSGERGKELDLKQEIMELVRTAYGDMHASTLEAMTKLAKSYFDQGQYQEAEKMWRQIASMRRETLGSRHEKTIQALRWLSNALYNQPRYAEAEIIWREVASLTQETLGAHHSDTLDALDWVADTLLRQERYAEAEVLIHEVLDARRSTLGKDNRPPIETLDILVHVVYNQKRYEESKELWKQIIEIKKESLGEQHEQTLGALCWLGIATKDLEQYAEAEALFTELLTKRRLAFGEHDASVIEALSYLAEVVHAQGRSTEANTLFKEVLTEKRLVFGDHDRSTIETLDQFVHLVYGQQDYVEAEQLWREIILAKGKLLGAEDAETLGAKFWLGFALDNQERYAEAEVVWREVAAARRTAFGEKHESVLEALYWLALLLHKQKRDVESEAMLKEVVAARREALGDHHSSIENVMEWLEEVQQDISTQAQETSEDDNFPKE